VWHDTTESGVKHQKFNSSRIKCLNYLSLVDITYDDHFTTSQMGFSRKIITGKYKNVQNLN